MEMLEKATEDLPEIEWHKLTDEEWEELWSTTLDSNEPDMYDCD